jgi:GST-like protein
MRGGYEAAEFLSVQDYRNVARWVAAIDAREPVQRGQIVNANRGPEEHRVPERHDAGDVDKARALMRAAGVGTPVA